MIDIDNIKGWEKGGMVAGDNIHEVIATKTGTDKVLHIRISGPTEYQSTTYSVALDKTGDVFPEYIEQGIEDEMKAKIRALEYARKN